jgi:hypothetical protein
LVSARDRIQAATDALCGAARRLKISVMPGFAASWLVPQLVGRRLSTR